METYYKDSIVTLINAEDYPPEVLGFIYWLLFRLATNKGEN